MLYIIFQPLQLLTPQRPQSAGFQVQHVHQPDEVHAFFIEAVPPRALATFSVALEELFAIVIQHIVFARHVEDILWSRVLQNLVDGVKLLRLREMTDVSCVQDKFRRRG